MPVRNEGGFISRALDGVLSQTYPSEKFEVIVIDGSSTDGTVETVHKYQQKYKNIHLVNNPQKIVPTGMNLALPLASGSIIIRVDGHCIIDADYVKNCVRYLSTGEIDGVGGPMKTIGENRLSKTIALAMSSKFGVGGSAFRTTSENTVYVDTVPFPAYTRQIVQQAGGYDEELIRNQDDEYNYRIRDLGGKILLASDIQSVYYSRGALDKLWKQYFQYGYWKVRVFQKHPKQMSLRQFVPPLFVSTLALFIIFSLLFSWGWLLLVGLATAYIIACLIASLQTSIKNGWNHFLLLPICYSILHLSYGLGFIGGLVKFGNRWLDKKGKVPSVRFKNATST